MSSGEASFRFAVLPGVSGCRICFCSMSRLGLSQVLTFVVWQDATTIMEAMLTDFWHFQSAPNGAKMDFCSKEEVGLTVIVCGTVYRVASEITVTKFATI